MSNLIVIPKFEFNAAPAKIDFNYEEVNAALVKYLEKYQNAVVTTETLADDKKLVSELNAEAKNINDLRIAQKKKLSEPISEFEEKMKALHSKYKEVSNDINEQVKRFEQVRLDNLAQMLDNERAKLREEMKIEERYFTVEFDDLVKLGSLTAKDNLAAAPRRTLVARIREQELDLQNKVERRLLELENACLRAGMDAPMTRENVEAFLYSDDETYSSHLEQLINSELSRQKAAQEAHERRIKEQLEREARQKAEAEQAAIRAREQSEQEEQRNRQSEPVQTPVEPEQRQEIERHYSGQPVIGVEVPDMSGTFSRDEPVQNQTRTNQDGTITRTVVATFEVTTKAHITDQQVTNRLGEVMAGAGITTLQKIEVI